MVLLLRNNFALHEKHAGMRKNHAVLIKAFGTLAFKLNDFICTRLQGFRVIVKAGIKEAFGFLQSPITSYLTCSKVALTGFACS